MTKLWDGTDRRKTKKKKSKHYLVGEERMTRQDYEKKFQRDSRPMSAAEKRAYERKRRERYEQRVWGGLDNSKPDTKPSKSKKFIVADELRKLGVNPEGMTFEEQADLHMKLTRK